jgi:hypothetical protein
MSNQPTIDQLLVFLREHLPTSVEEGFAAIEDRAALLSYVAQMAATTDMEAGPGAWAGIHAICGDIERTARFMRETLGVDVTNLAIVPAIVVPPDAGGGL